MEHLLENITFLQDKVLLRGYVFGVIHAGLIVKREVNLKAYMQPSHTK